MTNILWENNFELFRSYLIPMVNCFVAHDFKMIHRNLGKEISSPDEN